MSKKGTSVSGLTDTVCILSRMCSKTTLKQYVSTQSTSDDGLVRHPWSTTSGVAAGRSSSCALSVQAAKNRKVIQIRTLPGADFDDLLVNQYGPYRIMDVSTGAGASACHLHRKSRASCWLESLTIGSSRRFYLTISRRSQALKHLPGPRHGPLGILSALRSRHIHRSVTSWADQYGPIFKIRMLHFHVRSTLLVCSQGLQTQLHSRNATCHYMRGSAYHGKHSGTLLLPSSQSHLVWCCCPSQAVVVTDPTLAHEVLRHKALDKFRFQYSFLDPVCASSDTVVFNMSNEVLLLHDCVINSPLRVHLQSRLAVVGCFAVSLRAQSFDGSHK